MKRRTRRKAHERVPRGRGPAKPSKIYHLKLFVTGQGPRSAASIRNLTDVCHEYLEGRFELQIVDLYRQPELAKEAQVIAAPTLVKRLPLPLRRLVGDLSNKKEVLLGLDLKG